MISSIYLLVLTVDQGRYYVGIPRVLLTQCVNHGQIVAAELLCPLESVPLRMNNVYLCGM